MLSTSPTIPKAQSPNTQSRLNTLSSQSKSSSSSRKPRKGTTSIDTKTFDKENSRNSPSVNAKVSQKKRATSAKQPLATLYSPSDSKTPVLSPGTPSRYKIVRRVEDKDRVKVGFVVANGPVIGMHVVKVTPGLPADLAGLQVGDLINVINGHQTSKVEDFRTIAAHFRPGDAIPIKITREVETYPQNIHLLMRIPKQGKRSPFTAFSPQKEIARQLKMQLAKMKAEKDRREREIMNKIKREKQKILEEKKTKEDKMREELEKRKAAARLKRIEMKKRQEQLKNEEVVLLQELRARRAARKADLQVQMEMTEKQKLEELARVQQEEKKWNDILKEEKKNVLLLRGRSKKKCSELKKKR